MWAIGKSILSFGGVILLGASQNAVAQDYYTPAINVVYDYASQTALTNSVNQNAKSQIERTPPKTNTKPDGIQSPNASFTYIPSKSIRSKNIANFVAKMRAADPANGDNIETTYGSVDVIESFGGAIAPFGLRVDNAADTFAVWWIYAWQTANNDTRNIDAKTYKSVSAQAARSFAGDPQFTNMTDANKQEFSESLLFQTIITSAAKNRYGSDPVNAKTLADAVKISAKKSGLDLDAVTLTEDGFVPVTRK
jgi:hypothetical protein